MEEKKGLEVLKKIDEIRERIGEEELKILEKQIESLNRLDISFEKQPKINKLMEKLKSELIKALHDIKHFLKILSEEKRKYSDLELDIEYEVAEENILKDYTTDIRKAIKVIEELDRYSENIPLVENIVLGITENLEKLRKLLNESAKLLIEELKFTEEEIGSEEDKERKRISVFRTVLEKFREPIQGDF